MKLLLLIFSVLVVAGGLLLLYFTPGKFPYYPFEEISEGHLVRVPDERVPQVLDKVEAVLKEEKIPFQRKDSRTLYFDISKRAPRMIHEIERRAGLRKT